MAFGLQSNAQAPANDSCHNAYTVNIGSGGFTIGTFQSDSIQIDSATIQVGEYFHSSIVSAGNDKKSVWYKFYLPARRGVSIELKQNSNAISTKDCGFTTYKSDQCLPTSTMATAAKLTTLNQFGSSFHPCMDPGWYFIQVSAKARAKGKIFLELTTSFPYQYSAIVNAEYDVKDSAYYFGDQIVGKYGSQSGYIDYEMGCYTINDSSEYFADLGSNYLDYNQSGWFVFKANGHADNTQLKFNHASSCSVNDTIAIRLFKGDCRNGGSLTLMDSSFGDWSSNSTCYSSCNQIVRQYKCTFDSGEYYSVQLLYHKDLTKTMRFELADQTSQYDTLANKPTTNSSTNLGIIRGSNTNYFGFSCDSYIESNPCGNTNYKAVTLGEFDYNLSQWFSFEIDQQSKLDLTISNGPNYNYKRYNYLGFRLFKDSITSNCSAVDTNNLVASGTGNALFTLNCLEPGKYAIQLLGTDTVRDYSNWRCYETMHLGGDYRVVLNQSELPVSNRFALSAVTDADSINNLSPLPNYTTVYGGYDTISCNDGIRPEEICDTTFKKTMYRSFVIGDATGDGVPDSGMVYISGLQTAYSYTPYYSYRGRHRLYKGNAFDLRASQSVSKYPDTLTGLVPFADCISTGVSANSFCITPGTYTLVSFFDETAISKTERPNFNFYTAKTKFNTYAKTEVMDSVKAYQYYYGEYDTFTCSQNPDTIDGVFCGVRNTYHVFYLDMVSVVQVGLNYTAYAYAGNKVTLFDGDIRNGKSGLRLHDDGNGLDWSCVNYQASTDCKPMQPGWYTVMVSDNRSIAYDSLNRSEPYSGNALYIYPHQVTIYSRATNVQPPKYYRPSKAAFVDSLVNNNLPLSYDTNYNATNGMHLKLAKYTFPQEVLECELDTPLNHYPKGAICDTLTTDIVYYTFNLEKDAYLKVWGNTSGGTWDVKMFNFDVRKDSSKLSTGTPVQDCNYVANQIEFCNLKAGVYSLVYFCRRTSGTTASVQPIAYIDSVATSRFDHAANTYDFGFIPGTDSFYSGKVGDLHPLDTSLPASHDMITCRTGAQLSDPTNASCGGHINPFVYAADTNVVLFPYDSAYIQNGSTSYYPWGSTVRKNLWYSFVIGGRGNVTVNLKGLNSSLQLPSGYSLRFAVYETDEDGSLSLATLKSTGKIDSTLSDGLSLIVNDYGYCYYASPLSATFSVSSCEEVRPRRYYVLVEANGYRFTGAASLINQNVWLEVKYDSIYIPDTKFDYYSTANKINGLNERNLLNNGNFDKAGGWTADKGYWLYNYTTVTPKDGSGHLWAYSYYAPTNDTVRLSQTVNLGVYASEIGAGTATVQFSGYIQSKNETTPDEGRVLIDYLDASGSVLANYTSSWIASTSGWQAISDFRTIPKYCTQVKVRLESKNSSAYYHDVYFDDFDLRVTVSNPNITTVLEANTLYQGDLTYYAGSTLDTTDFNRTYPYYYYCNDKSTAGTVWYKFDIDSTGWLYYNHIYSYLSSGNVLETYNSDAIRMRVYRSTKSGDSINGLTYIPAISTSSKYNSVMGNTSYICVSPGTYYVQLNKCNLHQCSDYVVPQLMFDFHTGDFCENAVPLYLDTLEKDANSLLVNCHTIGTDFGEDGSNMGCLYGPSGYKSSWFVVNYSDTTKVDLEFSLAEYTDAKASEIRYRTYYGNCKSLTSAPCNNNALTTFTLDCIRKGTYYVQVVTPDYAKGDLTMTVEAKENTDTTCNPVDIFQPNAAFSYNTGCPENVVYFNNTSSQGDSIRYLWDFDYNGLTDTVLHPIVVYPAISTEKTYNVKLVVEQITRGSRDSIEIQITVPFAPYANIANNDTILCAGESVELNATISHGTGIWNTGETDTNITVSTTGIYYFDMQDKAGLLNNPSFEQNPTSNGWTAVSGTWNRTGSYSPTDSSYLTYASNASSTISELYQDVDVSSDSVEIDAGLAKTSLIGFIKGYSTYGDEGQISLEYRDKNNNLLAIYRSGYVQDVNWQKQVHSRSTPKGTRKLRVVIESNRQNTVNNTSYAFFDGLVLKMRSACSYKDSVYVQVNQLPTVDLPDDNLFCKGDSIGVVATLSYFDPYVIQDSLKSNLTGILRNSATHTASDQYAILTNTTDPYLNGEIEWTDSSLAITDSFTISFDYYSTGAGGQALWFYLFNSSTPTSEDQNAGGYSINLDAANNNAVQLNWSGSRRNTTYTGIDIDNGTWRNVRIEYNNQSFKVYIDGVLYVTYKDATARTQAGYKLGIGARNYGYYNEYRVRNIHVSKNNPSFLVIPKLANTSRSYVWNDGVNDSIRWIKNTQKFSVKIIDQYGCESNTDSVQVTAVGQFDSLFTNDETVCSLLDTFRLTKPASTGYFYGHSAVDSSGLVTVDSASFGSNVLYFSVIDTFGCLALDTGVFVVDSVPVISIDTVFARCKNSPTFKMSVNNAYGYFYGGVYIDSLGNFDPAQTTQRINKVYYATNGAYCVGKDSIDVIIDSVPTVSLSALGPFCLNDSARTFAKPKANGWFNPQAYLDSNGLFTPSIATAGSHKVYFTFVDGKGCMASDSQDVIVDTIPDASITAVGPFCENAGIQTLSAVVNTGGVFTKTSFLDSTGNFDPSIALAGNHQVYYQFTDGNGCSNLDSTTITIDSIPDASIANAGPFCANSGVKTLAASLNYGGKFTATSYIDTAGNFNPFLAAKGANTIYYTFADGNGCSNTDSNIVVVDSVPDASIKAAGPFCLNDTIQLLEPLVNSGGKFITALYVDSLGRFNPSIASSGAHLVYYQFTDGNGCIGLDSTTVQVDTIPNAAITPAGPFCENAGIKNLTAKINTGGTFISTAYLDTAGKFNPFIATAGNHQVFYQFTDGNGCSNLDSISIQVDSIPDASITKSGPICENGGIIKLTPSLNSGGKFTASAFLDTIGNFDPSIATSGTHKVWYTFIDGNGCSNTDSSEIQVDSIPNASILAAGPFCTNDTVQQLIPSVNTGGIFTSTAYLDTLGNFNPQIALSGQHVVYYTFTDGNGCVNTDSQTVVIDSIPDASIAPAGPFCENAGIKNLTAKINTGGTFISTAYLDTAGKFNPFIATAGSYQVYYQFTDGNGCTNLDSISIQVDSIPDASIANAGPFCLNSGLKTLAATLNYGGKFTTSSYMDTAGNFDPLKAGKGVHKIYYSYVDGNGCSNTDSNAVQVDSIPDARITPAGPFCENADTQRLTPLVNTGGKFLANAFLDTAGNFIPNKATAGLHKIYYVISNGLGCTNTDSLNIQIDTIPNAEISASGPFCENAGVKTILPTLNFGGKFISSAFIDTAGKFNPMIAAVGSHVVYYQFVDGNGCSNVDSTAVTVDSIPDARILPAGPFCANDGTQQLAAQVHNWGSFDAMTYVSSTGSFNPKLAGSGNHKVYYRLTDGNGCANVDSIQIRVDTIPDASIKAAGPFCENDGIQQLAAQINTTGKFVSGSFIDTLGKFDPSIALAGNHKVFYRFTDGNGCTNVDSTNIQVDTIPDASITPAGPFCENDGVQKIIPLINSRGAFSPASLVNASNEFNPTTATAGVHVVYYTFTDGNGCKNIDSINITVDTIPDASIIPAGPFCLNEGIQTISPKINSGGSFTITNFLTSAGQFDPAIATTGTHKLYYNFTDGKGCSSQDSINIEVWDLPDASMPANGPFCANDVAIKLVAKLPGGTYGGGAFVQSDGTFDPTSATIGSNKIYHTVTDVNGCISIDSQQIIVNAIPSNVLTVSPEEGCEVLTVNYSTEVADSIWWKLGTTITTNQTSVQTNLNAGSYKLELKVFNANGCKVELDTPIVVYTNPIANFNYTPEKVYIDNPEYFFNDQSLGNVVGWKWYFGDNDSSSFEDPSHRYSVGGDYDVLLFVVDDNGCMDSTLHRVVVLDNLIAFIPSAISPNNDGTNDVFRFTGIGVVKASCSIFNRWGELIYRSDDFKEWDATYKGSIVPSGIYIYQATLTDVDGRRHFEKGTIQVVR